MYPTCWRLWGHRKFLKNHRSYTDYSILFCFSSSPQSVMLMDKICWKDAERGKHLSLTKTEVFYMTQIARISRSKSIAVYTSVRPATSTMTLSSTRNLPQKWEPTILVWSAFLNGISLLALPSRVLSSFSLSSLPFSASCRGDVDAKTCPPQVHPYTVGLILILPILRIAAEMTQAEVQKSVKKKRQFWFWMCEKLRSCWTRLFENDSFRLIVCAIT